MLNLLSRPVQWSPWLLFTTIACSPAWSLDWQDPEWHLVTSLSHNRQTYEDGSAQLTQLQFTHQWLWDTWDINLSLPWLYNQEGYAVNPAAPSASALCKRFLNASNAKRLRWLKRGIITPATAQTCMAENAAAPQTLDSSTSGLGDIELSGAYHWSLTDTTLLTLTVSHKFANGDEEQSLGTGSAETRMDLGLDYSISNLDAGLIFGYTAVHYNNDNNNDIEIASGFASAEASLGYSFNDRWRLGVGQVWQGAYFEEGENLQFSQLSLAYKPFTETRLQIATKWYQGNEDAPDRELMLNASYSF